MTVPELITLVAPAAFGVWALWLRYDNSTRAAERRWRANNRRAKAAGCPCGKPATVVREDHGVMGSVPAETWTCAEHAGASMRTGDGTTATPSWPRTQPCGTCTGRCGREGRIGGPIDTWHCPVRPGSDVTR